MKYPKAMLEAVNPWRAKRASGGMEYVKEPYEILDSLNAAGFLVMPKEPREWFICNSCWFVKADQAQPCRCESTFMYKMVKVREIIEGDE